MTAATCTRRKAAKTSLLKASICATSAVLAEDLPRRGFGGLRTQGTPCVRTRDQIAQHQAAFAMCVNDQLTHSPVQP
jgi:hypothetical protein